MEKTRFKIRGPQPASNQLWQGPRSCVPFRKLVGIWEGNYALDLKAFPPSFSNPLSPPHTLLKKLCLCCISCWRSGTIGSTGPPHTIPPVTLPKRLLRKSSNETSMKETVKAQPRSSLMTGGAKRGAPNPWLLEESEETRGLGFHEIQQQQQRIIQEQDAGLDALSSIISRQKQMGQEIGNELDEQNEIIDDLANLVENTDEKLRTETRRVNVVDRKSTSCGMIVVILLLLVAIVVVAVWPTK
ncbi:syntaxin-8 isoform X4 [Choloepus didactylus]|uniref:syntaxin-8 isoform X4 n=1 Tax=Choloepus didactylus TaxID=27675 RepID=UPI00189E7D05|nr:syntaxin-8 isoform X4 [Choloepus didactylus]